jgi:WD40 repeat protein
VSYQIDHVYGFLTKKRSCLYFGKTNQELIFPSAAIGILHDISSNRQKFFGGGEKDRDAPKYVKDFPIHQDDISCLSIAGGELRNIVVSGECGAQSTVHVWDTVSMQSIGQFSMGGSAKGVGAAGISPCQRYVAAVDQSNDHMMYIYNV